MKKKLTTEEKLKRANARIRKLKDEFFSLELDYRSMKELSEKLLEMTKRLCLCVESELRDRTNTVNHLQDECACCGGGGEDGFMYHSQCCAESRSTLLEASKLTGRGR
jgi:hypothetical protein